MLGVATMSVLMVGAGAIGQVLGYHLAQGGARVSFLVHKGHPLPASRAFTLSRRRRWGAPTTDAFRPHHFFTSIAELRSEGWDQVWLCVPSTALEPSWVEELAAATGNATLVFLPAGVEVVTRLRPPEDRTVVGLISLMSRFTDTGVAYWLPPLSALMVAGPRVRRDGVLRALRRGGCPAVAGDAARAGAFGSAVLIPHVVALEGAGWSYATFMEGRWLGVSVAATREAAAVAAAHLGVGRSLLEWAFARWLVRLVVAVARRLVPVDLPEFFRVHFTKVRRQSEAQLREYIALGERYGRRTEGLEHLVREVFERGSHLPRNQASPEAAPDSP